MAEPITSPTLTEAIEQFLATLHTTRTIDTYRWALNALVRFVADTDYAGRQSETDPPTDTPLQPPTDETGFQKRATVYLTSLHDDLLEEFYYWLGNEYQSQQTIRTYLSATRRFLTWLDARDLLAPDFQLGKAQNRLKAAQGKRASAPYKHRQIDPELPKVITYYDNLPLPQGENARVQVERLKILRARAIVHTLYASGGRVSEVASLTREMVLDGRIDEVHLVGKGGQPRVILLTSDAMRAIQAYLVERGDDYPGLFISHGRGRGKAIGRGTMWSVVKAAASALGLHKSTSPHSFRHFRATQLLNEGMPLESVQAYLGHRDISTTRKVYAHTKTAVLRDQLETFGRSPAESLEDLETRRRRRG